MKYNLPEFNERVERKKIRSEKRKKKHINNYTKQKLGTSSSNDSTIFYNQIQIPLSFFQLFSSRPFSLFLSISLLTLSLLTTR